MFEEGEEEWFGADFNKHLEHFNEMYENDDYRYMDADQVEFVLDHLLISNQFKKARWAADKSLEHFPNNNTLKLRKAQAISLAGELNGALRILGELEKFEPESLDLLLTTAACYSQLRNSDGAIKYFKRALDVAEGEEQTEIYIDLAMEYENQDNFRAATAILEKAFGDNNKNEAIVYELAYCYEQLDEYHKSVACFEAFIDENPYSFTTWYNLGNALAKLGDKEKALWAYDYCTLINEDFAPAYYNIANVYMDLDDVENAMKHYEKCLQIDGEDGLVFCSMGECYEEFGEFEKAYEAYDKSADLLPHLGDAWLGKGIVSDIIGHPHRAIAELEMAIKIDDRNADYWRALANAYVSIKDDELAITAFEKGFFINPRHDDLVLDWLAFVTGQSIQHVFETVEQHPKILENNVTQLVLTYCHWMLGNQTESMILFDDIVESDVSLAKSVFLHFPELKSVDYFRNRLEEIDESNNDEEEF